MLKKAALGFGLPLIVILCNGIVAWRLGGLSYGHFTWEAFAQSYGVGEPCGASSECASGFCVSGVCCTTACTGLSQTCTAPGSVGTCTNLAPAPALSAPLISTLALLLLAVGAYSLRRALTRNRRT